MDKKIWGYSDYCNLSLKAITNVMFDIKRQEHYPIVEDFGNTANLMIVESIKKSGGKILKTFEECVKDFYNELQILHSDTNFVDYLIVKRLKKILIHSNDFANAATMRDEEKRLLSDLTKYNRNLEISESGEFLSNPIFNIAENIRKYAMKLFELPDNYFKGEFHKEKDKVIAILRERKIIEIFE